MPLSVTPKLELKYCERCGGLWFRPQDGEEVYCARCAEAIKELPPVKKRNWDDEPPAIADMVSSSVDGSAARMEGGLA